MSAEEAAARVALAATGFEGLEAVAESDDFLAFLTAAFSEAMREAAEEERDECEALARPFSEEAADLIAARG